MTEVSCSDGAGDYGEVTATRGSAAETGDLPPCSARAKDVKGARALRCTGSLPKGVVEGRAKDLSKSRTENRPALAL